MNVALQKVLTFDSRDQRILKEAQSLSKVNFCTDEKETVNASQNSFISCCGMCVCVCVCVRGGGGERTATERELERAKKRQMEREENNSC